MKVYRESQETRLYISFYVCPKCPYCGKRFYDAVYGQYHIFAYKIVGDGWVRYISQFATTEGEALMAHTIASKAADLITWDEVEAEVVDALKERGIKKRTEAIVQVLDKIQSLENDYKKIDRPDVILQDENGKDTGKSYSPARNKERKELRDKIAKMERAVEKAQKDGNYDDVYNIAGGKQSSGSPDKGKGDGEAE